MRFWEVMSTTFLAIPFYFLWNFLAPIYLTNLPAVYLAIPFWHCAAIFLLIGVIRAAIFPRRRFGWHHHAFYGRCGKWKSYA